VIVASCWISSHRPSPGISSSGLPMVKVPGGTQTQPAGTTVPAGQPLQGGSSPSARQQVPTTSSSAVPLQSSSMPSQVGSVAESSALGRHAVSTPATQVEGVLCWRQ